MKLFKKIILLFLKKLELGSALAIRLTVLTGKSQFPIHPKHLLSQKPWFANYLNKRDVVLDLGCGNGQNTVKAAKFAKKIIATDLDKSSLDIASSSTKTKSIKNISYEIYNLEEKLKYKNHTFDKVLLLDVLEHLVKRDQILDEIRRVLKPEGLLILRVPNSQTSWKRLQRLSGMCSYSDPNHKIEFSANSIRGLLKKHNFKVVDFQYDISETLFRGLIDIIGAFSISLYSSITRLRAKKSLENPKEAVGFEVVAQK